MHFLAHTIFLKVLLSSHTYYFDLPSSFLRSFLLPSFLPFFFFCNEANACVLKSYFNRVGPEVWEKEKSTQEKGETAAPESREGYGLLRERVSAASCCVMSVPHLQLHLLTKYEHSYCMQLGAIMNILYPSIIVCFKDLDVSIFTHLFTPTENLKDLCGISIIKSHSSRTVMCHAFFLKRL